MTLAVQEMVSTTYVREIDASRRFYELFGFREIAAGEAATGAWRALRCDGFIILLASTTPPLELPRLPLLFYFYVDDVDLAVKAARACGAKAQHMGYPSHALGGEVKVLDPDGNTVLLGQRERSASQPVVTDHDAAPHFSLLKEATALVAAGGGASTTCQVLDIDGKRCAERAEVKLADSGGDSAWACLDHADEILVSVRGAFIASQAGGGISGYASRRRT